MKHIFLTRLVIETTSPMAINTGNRESGFDTQLARDANGLPFIPATSIAGVWSHLGRDTFGRELIKKWFGSTEQSASLTISNATIHDSNNKPVTPLTPKTTLMADPILNLLLQNRPLHRERVALNDRGVAKDTAKFDQLLLPKGVRFSITLRWSDKERQDNLKFTQPEWFELLSLWQDPRFAFGASTRNGLGQIKVTACENHDIDLSQGPKSGHTLQQLLSSQPIENQLPEQTKSNSILLAHLPLQAIDNWRCGTGTQLLQKNAAESDEDNINIISYSEPAIQWPKNDHAKISQPQAVLCGSSIKGILAHRIAYHLRKHQGVWAEDMDNANHDTWQTRPDALKALLGIAADKPEDSLAGSLYIPDVNINYEHTVMRQHNSIDRFTGGVRQGALYSEELLYQPSFTVSIWCRKDLELNSELYAALNDTLNDLQSGFLPMGAGSGRGSSLVLPKVGEQWQVNLDKITQLSAPTVEKLQSNIDSTITEVTQ